MVLAEQAIAFAGKGQFETALRICAKADHVHQDFLDIMYVRGLIASMQRDYGTAVEWLARACQAAPKRTHYFINYASCLYLSGQEDKAVEIYQIVLAKSRHLFEQANGNFTYGSALEAVGEFNQAMQFFDKGRKLEPRNVELLMQMADVRNKLLDKDAAMTLVQKAHAIAPDDVSVLYILGLYLMQQGKVEKAHIHLREALTCKPNYLKALALLLSSGNYEEREADISTLRTLYNQQVHGSEPRIMGAFALGNVADKNKTYEQAFTFWQEGNSQRRARIIYKENEQEELHQAAKDAFPASRLTKPAIAEACAAEHIFIVGMPRCGSTLLEQALSRHPALQASGEIDAMQQAIVGRMQKVRNRTLIDTLPQLDDLKLGIIGHEYDRRLQQEYHLEGRIVDKTLNNYQYAGLIARALPKARIIHVRREPLASCLSMFQTDFSGSIPYSFELEELGRQYQRYQSLMQHWREALPEGVMLEVSYEDLVNNPEAELRRLLEGCNLEWHEECVNTHKATGSVATASLFQVRKPMHQKSVARWKHYEKQLAPLSKYLQ